MKKLTLLFIFLFIGTANAAHINFEINSGTQNISPGNPYTENGFTFSPTNSESAVFSLGSGFFPGDDTGFFGFAEINSVTITTQSHNTFDLTSLLIGLTTIAAGGSADITITGNLAAGGTVSETFAGVSALTLADLNWTGLSSVTITATDDIGFDRIIATERQEVDKMAYVNFEVSVNMNVAPGRPYTENGFTFSTTTADSIVLLSGLSVFPGDDTGFFGFAENNSVTITTQSHYTFDLTSLLIGLTTIATGGSADITINGNLAAGGTVSETFAGVSALTLADLNWTGLSSVTITATDDIGFDSIIAKRQDDFPWIIFMPAITKPRP